MVEEQDQTTDLTLEEQALIDAMSDIFDARQMLLIDNCNVYANGKPAGLPGHNIMIIVSKLHEMLKTCF